MSRVAWPSSNARSRFWQQVVRTLAEISRTPFVMNADFNDQGLLEGITVQQVNLHDQCSGATEAKGYSILVPPGEWLKAVMLTLGKTGGGYCDCAIVGITVFSITSPPVSSALLPVINASYTSVKIIGSYDYKANFLQVLFPVWLSLRVGPLE